MPKTIEQLDEHGLTIKERKLADLVLIGTPRYIAVTEAGFNVTPKTTTGGSLATEVLKRPKVAAYMLAMRQQAAEVSGLNREEFLRDLANTMRSTPNDASMDNPLCEIDYVGKDGDAVARFMPKSKVALLIMKMLGWEAPKKLEVSGTVNIVEYDLDLGSANAIDAPRSAAQPLTPQLARMVKDREEAIEAEAEEIDFDTEEPEPEELEEHDEEPEPPPKKKPGRVVLKPVRPLVKKPREEVETRPGAKSLRSVIAKETPLLRPTRR